jgi:hypothetical protein
MLGFNPRVVHVGCVVDKVALEQDFLQALWFSSANHHYTNTPYSSKTTIYLRLQYQGTQSHPISTKMKESDGQK